MAGADFLLVVGVALSPLSKPGLAFALGQARWMRFRCGAGRYPLVMAA